MRDTFTLPHRFPRCEPPRAPQGRLVGNVCWESRLHNRHRCPRIAGSLHTVSHLNLVPLHVIARAAAPNNTVRASGRLERSNLGGSTPCDDICKPPSWRSFRNHCLQGSRALPLEASLVQPWATKIRRRLAVRAQGECTGRRD